MEADAICSAGAVQGPDVINGMGPVRTRLKVESVAVDTATVPEAFAVNGLAAPGAINWRDVAPEGMSTGVMV